METKSIFAQVVIDNYDINKKEWTIDAWKTFDDMEEGEVIGSIDLKGNIKYKDNSYKDDANVKEVIDQFFDENIVSEVMTISKFKEKMTNILESVDDGESVSFRIYNKDGFTAYGIEKHTILKCAVYAVGMYDNGVFNTFPTEDIDEIISFIFEDITSMIGDSFVIEIID